MVVQRNNRGDTYKNITKALLCVKPVRRKDENGGSEPTLALSDIFVTVHIRDKTSGSDIQLFCKNFQELVRESGNYKVYFPEYEVDSELLPFRLTGDFKDYFHRSFEECWQFPQRIADDLGVSIRLWRNDTRQAVCLFHNKGPDEVQGLNTLHKAMTKLPCGWLFIAVKCSFQARFPPSYNNHIDNWKIGNLRGWKHYNIDDWMKIRYSIGSLEFGLCGSGLKSGEDLVALLNVMDWE